MIVDGRAIATAVFNRLQADIANLSRNPRLTVFTCAPNKATQKYLSLKKRKANDLGIVMEVVEFPATVSTGDVIERIKSYTNDTDGIVVQLPFPSHINREELLANLPASLDIDKLNYDGSDDTILPPVVGAIAEISHTYQVEWANKNVVVIGKGLLVGKPACLWAKNQGAKVVVIEKNTEDADQLIKSADIIISGAGVAGLITPEKITEGVVIFDAGTSEDGGELKGDADPDCALKASLFTPVPGGIGPITIAMLLSNLVKSSK